MAAKSQKVYVDYINLNRFQKYRDIKLTQGNHLVTMFAQRRLPDAVMICRNYRILMHCLKRLNMQIAFKFWPTWGNMNTKQSK